MTFYVKMTSFRVLAYCPTPFSLRVFADVSLVLLLIFFLVYLVLYDRVSDAVFCLAASFAVLIFSIAFVSLKLPVYPHIKFKRSREAKVIAHRAAGYDAPENTLAAIRQAKLNGANLVEIDVQLTKDGIPVVFNDESVDQLTGGSGKINQLTYEQVKSLNASAKHRLKSKFPNEPIPTLEEATAEAVKLGLGIFYDVRSDAFEVSDHMNRLFKKYPSLYRSSYVISFYPHVIYAVRWKNSEIATGLLDRPGRFTYSYDGSLYNSASLTNRYIMPLVDAFMEWNIHSWIWWLCGNSLHVLHKNAASLNEIEFWRQRNIEVVVWMVNTTIEKQYYENYLQCSYLTDSLINENI